MYNLGGPILIKLKMYCAWCACLELILGEVWDKDFWPAGAPQLQLGVARPEAVVCTMVKHPFWCLEAASGGSDRDVLARGKCLQALAALRHTKWFQVCVSSHTSTANLYIYLKSYYYCTISTRKYFLRKNILILISFFF